MDPAEVLGSESVLGTTSAVSWFQYKESLSDLDIMAVRPEMCKARVKNRLRASLSVRYVLPPRFHADSCYD